jgi:hypothetical protein
MTVIRMSRDESTRLRVQIDVADGRLSVADASGLIGVGQRQVYRLLDASWPGDRRRDAAARDVRRGESEPTDNVVELVRCKPTKCSERTLQPSFSRNPKAGADQGAVKPGFAGPRLRRLRA